MSSIIELEDKISRLTSQDKELFEAIFEVYGSEGQLRIPRSFRAKARKYFGKKAQDGQITESEEEVLERLKVQKVVRTFNKWTGEGALFNWLRASRPGMRPEDIKEEKEKVYERVEQARKDCDFCDPRKYTSEDVFGRIQGKHCITGANVAKYDAWSGMVYFREHDPLEFNREELSDYVETGFKWVETVHEHYPEFRYPVLVWNCLQKAGASQVHGHAQVLVGRGMHYAKVEILRRAAQRYEEERGRKYFDDLFTAHDLAGLAFSEGDARIFAYLTPVKEKEVIVITSTAPSVNDYAKSAVFKVLRCFIDRLGVTSFNLTISMPAFGDHDLPYVMRIVDRGSIFKPTADMGGMELYGSSVVATDPYMVIKALRDF